MRLAGALLSAHHGCRKLASKRHAQYPTPAAKCTAIALWQTTEEVAKSLCYFCCGLPYVNTLRRRAGPTCRAPYILPSSHTLPHFTHQLQVAVLVLLQLLPSVLVLVLPRIGIIVLLTVVVFGDKCGNVRGNRI